MEDSSIKKLFGLRIKNLRKKRNLTQAELAESVEVDTKHIYCIESGKNFPSPELIGRLATAFNISPKELFEFANAPTPVELKNEIIKSLDIATDEEVEKIYIYTKFIVP